MPATTFQTAIGRVRAVGLVEGVSYLVLLGIAMPLKYLGNMPLPVKVVGWIHGVLFVSFCAVLAYAWLTKRLTFVRSVLVFLAALVPFGTFAIDKWLKGIDEAEPAAVG